MRGLTPLEAGAHAAFARRLEPGSRRPLAVALSGGGDSLALTLIADAWARRAGRDLVVLTVDHRLQAASADWTQACRAHAERLARPFRSLAWDGEKPAPVAPAVARAARHRLLAEAAREAGAEVILMGHTADDRLEAVAMRAAGATTPEPREWAPSPAWPEGRRLFLLRPLLAARRSELRDWLRARGAAWIDDPANADLRFARPRARPTAATSPDPPPPVEVELALARQVAEETCALILPRAAFRAAEPAEAARLLAMACVCAGGGARLPDGARVGRLAQALTTEGPVAATLAGARVRAHATLIRIAREAGEAARGGLAPVAVQPGRAAIWDGRFEIEAERPVTVRATAGLAARLPPAQRRRLLALPAGERGALPVVTDSDGRMESPVLGAVAGVRVTPLAAERLRAASGLVTRERA